MDAGRHQSYILKYYKFSILNNISVKLLTTDPILSSISVCIDENEKPGYLPKPGT